SVNGRCPISLITLVCPMSCEKLILVLPDFPFFVVIMTTPAAAFDPYNAAADAPFNISIFSISCGLISAILLLALSWLDAASPPEAAAVIVFRPGCVLVLSQNTPSITYNG